VLQEGKHFTVVETVKNWRTIKGQIHAMCRIARNHRMILSTDLAWSYIVIDKAATDTGEILITLRRAGPIVKIEPIQAMLGGTDV
jgi:Asp/Glu/hydantoin racemase